MAVRGWGWGVVSERNALYKLVLRVAYMGTGIKRYFYFHVDCCLQFVVFCLFYCFLFFIGVGGRGGSRGGGGREGVVSERNDLYKLILRVAHMGIKRYFHFHVDCSTYMYTRTIVTITCVKRPPFQNTKRVFFSVL